MYIIYLYSNIYIPLSGADPVGGFGGSSHQPPPPPPPRQIFPQKYFLQVFSIEWKVENLNNNTSLPPTTTTPIPAYTRIGHHNIIIPSVQNN